MSSPVAQLVLDALAMMKRTGSVALLAMVSACGDMEPGEENFGETEQAVTATTHTESVPSVMTSEVESLGGFDIMGLEPVTLTVFNLHVGAQVKWEAIVATDLTWDTDKVRQGQQLDIARQQGVSIGTLKIVWTITGVLSPLGLFDIDIGTIPIGLDVGSCNPKFDAGGTAYECSASSDSLSIVDTPGIPASPYVNLSMGVHFTITPDKGVTHRSFFVGDDELVAATDLDVTTSKLSEQLAMPCSKPVGTSVQYVIDPMTYAPSVSASQRPHIAIGIRDPIIGAAQLPAIWEDDFGPAIPSSPDLSMTGAGNAVDLGELLANNMLPTISPLGPFSGSEGTAVGLSAQVQSACPITSYVWQFSDGTQSYGPSPQRVFGDDGQLDGQLTVKDATNLSAVGSFDVSITNKAPVPSAGPDTSEMWGKAIAFQGQAVDPGSLDQATLVYEWNFGDNTPALGGMNVNHAYTQPGDYVATLKVCDDHVCATDALNVQVRKRGTTLAYTGSNTGTYSASAQLTASLTDELGNPVPGAAIAFALAGVAMGSAQTSGSGAASKAVDVGLATGSYPVGAGFGGTALYDASQTAEQFEVARMGSSLQYTGSLSGGPNKIVNLSGKLVDGLGRPLAGKLVVFKLGAQQVSATTDASGIASTPLKLAQKAGQYQLTSTWTPAAGDDTKWSGTSTAATFKLQAK